MHFPKASGVAVQTVCFGSALLSAAYYATWAPNTLTMIALGGAVGALDLVKPEMFARAKTAETQGQRWLLWGLGGLLAIVSMIAVDGMLMRLRSDAGGERLGAQSTYDRAKAQYDEAAGELATLPKTKPLEALEAELAGRAGVDLKIWNRTSKCTDVTKDDSDALCKPATRVREQIGIAKRRAKLEAVQAEAKGKLDNSTRPQAADPQVKAIADMIGGSEGGVMWALIFVLGVGYELVACFGKWLLAPPPPPPPVEEPKPEPVLTTEQQALKWLQAEVDRFDGKVAIPNKSIADQFGVDPGTVTKWRRRWVEAGAIRELKDGRQIMFKRSRQPMQAVH